jgi:hypothetical protein
VLDTQEGFDLLLRTRLVDDGFMYATAPAADTRLSPKRAIAPKYVAREATTLSAILDPSRKVNLHGGGATRVVEDVIAGLQSSLRSVNFVDRRVAAFTSA